MPPKVWELPLPDDLQQALDNAPTLPRALDDYFEKIIRDKWADPAVRCSARHAYYEKYELRHALYDIPHDVLRDAGFFAAMMRQRKYILLHT